MLRSFVYLFWNNKALYFSISYEVKVNISKPFILDRETYIYEFPSSYHLLFAQMQIIFLVETVNECGSRLFSS